MKLPIFIAEISKIINFHNGSGFWKNKIIIWHPSAEPEKGTYYNNMNPARYYWIRWDCNLSSALELLLHLLNYMKQGSSLDEVGSPYMPRVASHLQIGRFHAKMARDS
jgi:hypothetical protein